MTLTNMTNQKKRLANFEVLRCLSMVMIIIIHFFTHGMKGASADGAFSFDLCGNWGG